MASLAITLSSLTLAVGHAQQLEAQPAGDDVTWQSADPAIATVTATGLVTGVAAGTAAVLVRRGSAPNFATIRLPITVHAVETVPIEPPVEPDTGPRTLLTVADLTYLGNFRFPNIDDMVFAWGCFTGQRLDADTIRFYALGKRDVGEPLISFDYPGMQTNWGDGMPVATVVRNFGSIWDGRRLVNETGPITHGLRWHEGRLWWTYSTPYEGSSNNPSLCCTELDENTGTFTSYGPWRAGGTTSPKFNNAMAVVPEWFQSETGCGPLLQIAGIRCANGPAPWGMANQIFTPPAHTDPTQIADNGPNGFQTTPVTDSGIHYPFPRENPQYLICGWNDVNQAGPGGVPSSYYCGANNEFAIAPRPADPTWGGGGMALDWVECGEWIDTGTKHGIVMFGQWVDHVPGTIYPSGTLPHCWYGPNTCCHGHIAPANTSTGPATSSLVSMVFMQDPADYAHVLKDGRDPTTVLPSENALFQTIPANEHGSSRPALYVFGSCWYDAQERLLFVSHRLGYDSKPVMHVFEVAA